MTFFQIYNNRIKGWILTFYFMKKNPKIPFTNKYGNKITRLESNPMNRNGQ
jgi:hypothetical protein